LLVRTRRASYCTSSSCASTLTRTVWDGDHVLYEVRAKGGLAETVATLESDVETSPVLIVTGRKLLRVLRVSA
jgi:hypothetical protein